MRLSIADIYFSRYIRHRDSVDGYCTCPVCGERMALSMLECGHFIKRRNLSTRWYEDNAMAICKWCNTKMESDIELSDRYAKVIFDRIGAERWGELMKLKQSNAKLMQYEIDEIAEYYKSKIDGR